MRTYGGRADVIFNVFYTRLGRKVLKGIRDVNLTNLGVVQVKILGEAQQYRLIVVGDTARCNMVLELISATVQRNKALRRSLRNALR